MIGRSPRNMVATLCCLLAVATSAYGACARVMWATWVEGPAGQERQEWQLSAYETKAQCDMTEASARLQWMLKAKEQVVFQCLPDTVDPRGQKGK